MRYLPGWDSLEAVSRYHSFAELAGIGLLAFLVIAELLSFSYGGRKDDLTEERQQATERTHEEEMARLHRETAQLSADAENAKAQIATAQKETAEARLETERLRAETRGRLVTPAQWESLSRSLKGHDLSVHLFCPETDPEAKVYALSLSASLELAGMKDTKITPLIGSDFWGLILEGPPGPDFELLKSAFHEAGIDFIARDGPQLAIRVGNKPPTVKTTEMPLPPPPTAP